jgi:hypothetical protein
MLFLLVRVMTANGNNLEVRRERMQETTYLSFNVHTFDGKDHEVAAHKSGKSWKASAYIDGKYVEGRAAKKPEGAIENWKSAYKYTFDF